MRSPWTLVPVLALASGLVILSSCGGTVVVGRRAPSHPPVVVKSGPPPHAPAHGYRHKHGRVVLVYDAGIDVYVVEGHKGYYYCRDRFYRVRGGNWQASFDFGGPWRTVPDTHLPRKLYEHEMASAHKHKHKHKAKYK
jgi:hypothetical protein